MYTVIEKILNVKWFALDTEGDCLYNDKENVYSLDSKEIIYKHHIGLQEILFKGKYFINDMHGKGVYFDNEYKPYAINNFIHLFKDNFVLFSKREEEERNTFINKIGTNEYFSIKSASTIYILYSNYLIRKNFELNSIEAFSFPTGVPLWQFDLSELGEYKPLRTETYQKYEVLKFLGVWRDQLLVACSNGVILSLDINTGQEIQRFHRCLAYTLGSNTYHHFNNAYPFVLDEKREILFALHTYYYMEIKLDSGEVIVVDLHDNMAANKISIFRQSSGYAWDDTHIYTIGETADYKSPLALGDRCLLAFNRFSKDIEWQYIFENDSINTDIPQVSGDKLYQLSAQNVLHIFKKND